ncbi:MAG: YdcH family protein [Asticcacaulis sp.]
MAIDARIRELDHRHQTLDVAIRDELRRPVADAVRLKELKRRKLKLKDEMQHLKSQTQMQ